jgi:PKD repeat protein
MKTYGIKISVIIFFSLSFLQIVKSQSKIDPCLCNRKDCGDIIASFKLVSNSTVVCDGYEFEVQNNSTIPDVSYYIWSWGDGKLDSVTTTANQKHIYNIPLDKVCLDNQTTYQICLLAVKRCGTKYSCHNNNSPVTVIHRPLAKFNYVNLVCVNKKVDFKDNSCNVDESKSDAYLWTFHDGTTSTQKNTSKTYTTPGIYTVKLKVKNSCGENEILETITVIDYPDAVVNVSASAKDSVVCVGDIITLIDQSNQWSAGNIWTFPSTNVLTDTLKWKLDAKIRKLEKKLPIDTIIRLDTIKFVVLQSGTYTFKLTSTNVCGTKDWAFPLKVVSAPVINLSTPSPFCETADYYPIPNVTGDVKSYVWTFPGGTPASSNQKIPGKIIYNTPGTYTITLKSIAECDTITKSVQLVINSRTPVKITNPNKVYCQSSSPDTLKADRTGGVWSGQGITNKTLGIFNPGGLSPGKYDITYSIGQSDCQSSDKIVIEVVASQNVMTKDITLCENSQISQLEAIPSSGVWSGHPAVTSTGMFDPAISGIGIFTLKYGINDNNGCMVTRNPIVSVEKLPALMVSDSTTICIGSGTVSLKDILKINTNPSGGTISYTINSSTVADIISPANYNISTLPVKITYKRNECVVSKISFLRFIEKPIIPLTSDTTLCIQQSTFQLNSNVNGGQWSGPGVNSTGLINLATAGDGVKKYTYTFQPNTSCEQKITVNITIKDPAKGLTAGPDQKICSGNVTFFTLTGNTPIGGIWSGKSINPNTGQIDITQLQEDSLYTYKYCLTEAAINGCEACRDKKFIVHSLPKPIFDISGLACIGQDVVLSDKTSGMNTIKFDLGDGTSSSQKIITHNYAKKGTYVIKLEVTDKNGCKKDTTQSLYVTTKPISAFSIPQKDGCAPFILNLQNTSTGDNLSYLWSVNKRNYAQIDPPPILLDYINTDTTFIIQLAAANECGTIIFIDSVRVHPYPKVNFGVSDLSGCSPLSINFSNVSTGNPDTYFWDMGNGTVLNERYPAPQIYTTTKDSISKYSIILIGKNKCGIDSIKKNITVYPPDVTAFIEASGLSYCQYDSLKLSAYSTPGAINTWKILAPDGTTLGASGNIVQLSLIQTGEYIAILYANRCGSDSDTVKINAKPAPMVDFDVPSFSCLGSIVAFKNLSISTAGSVWDYGDGSTDASTNGNHVYIQPGIYKVKLTSYSLLNNCPFTIEKMIRIIGLPTASFIPSSLSGCEPLVINFTNNSTPGTKYDWSFGDMTSNSQAKEPMHSFNLSGLFEVKLTVHDEFGCFTDTSVLNVIVHPKPKSNFTFKDKIYCHRYDTVHLANQSIGSVSHKWSLDGQIFDNFNVIWVPTSPGKYDLKLISGSNFGCYDTISKSITILPSPQSKFISDKSNGCLDLILKLENLSENATKYVWNFGNGTTSVEKSPSYTYITPGNFTVSLISISENGCPNDTFMRGIIVYPKPIAAFTATKDNICGIPTRVTIKNISIGNVDNEWKVNGNLYSKDPDYAYIFNAPGTYQIQLVIKNEFLCADTIIKSVDIYHQPKANFVIKTEACENETIVLQNQSINALLYEWTIESKGKITNAEPKLVFDKAGKYAVRLIAIYNEYCKDTFTLALPIQIFRKPKADFDYRTGFEDNLLGEVSFNNLSVDFTRSLWNFGDGFSSDDENPYHEYDINRDVLVSLIAFNDNNGSFTCQDSISKPIAPEWITTFYAPNALSPEYGDGEVKVFKPVGIGIVKYKMSVYSPWGEKVWSTDHLEKGSPSYAWDGMYNGSYVPQGAYSWIADVTFVNGFRKVFKGSVTVVR